MAYGRLFDLPVIEQKTEHISLRKADDLDVIVIDHPRVRAAATLQGAHLIAWQPADQHPVLWLSDATVFRAGTAVRGGVPVCWPWFGPAHQPSHGFARISAFQLESAVEDNQEAHLRFVLTSDKRTAALWPHEFVLSVDLRLGKKCEITLQAQGAFESTGALHTYLDVGDIEDVTVTGLGAPYVDEVSGQPGSQAGPLKFPDRTDRVYTDPEATSHIDQPALNRTVEIRHTGNTDVVAWNPGPELSRSMTDLTDDGYREFVCVETARISTPMVSSTTAPAVLTASISIDR